MTDRERAEKVLKDAGFELSDEPYSGAHWWHASRWWTARFVQGLNEMKLEVGVPVRDVPTLIPFPSLTAEERKAVGIAIRHIEYYMIAAPMQTTEHRERMEEAINPLRGLLHRLGGDTP